jgi:HEAT repeat protein
MRNPRASRELARALRDEDAAVRAAAVGAFGKLGTLSVSRTIAAMRRTDADPNVRNRAAQVCDRHGWIAGPVPRV